MQLTIFTSILLVVFSILLLWFGADWLVKGASKMALSINVKPIVIGLTVVAFGTSAPELMVSIMAAFKEGGGEMALGNILGSNIANIALILGVCALISPLQIQKDLVKSDIPFMALVTLLTYLLARFGAAHIGGEENGLSRLDGFILLGFFAYFLYKMFKKSKDDSGLDPELREILIEKKSSNWLNFLLVIAGVVFLVGGAKALVTGGEFIAEKAGIPKLFISLTMFAVGTSIPELAASGMAAYRKETELCLGNIIGSNILNLIIVLALTICLTPIVVSERIIGVEFLVTLAVAIVLYFLCRLGSPQISRLKGLFLLIIYVGFVLISYRGGF